MLIQLYHKLFNSNDYFYEVNKSINVYFHFIFLIYQQLIELHVFF